MIICPNCKKELADGTRFCEECGAKMPEAVFCSNCGTKAEAGMAFCQNCGNRLTGTPAPVAAEAQPETVAAPVAEQPAAPVVEQPAAPAVEAQPKAEKKPFVLPGFLSKLSKKTLIFGGAGIAVVLILAILLPILLLGGGTPDLAMFIKDGEMQLINFEESTISPLTDRLVDTSDSVSNQNIAGTANRLGMLTVLSPDGDTLFYPDRVTNSDGFSLFIRSLKNPAQQPVKLDSQISYYFLSTDGKLVTYLKDSSEKALYWHNLQNKDKIASGVKQFKVSPDGRTVLFQTSEQGLYLKVFGNEKQKIDSEISDVYYISDDAKTVIYTKENAVYKYVAGSEKSKLVSDIHSIVEVYENGALYYTKKTQHTLTAGDFFNDDMIAADQGITEPVRPEYPDYDAYANWDDYYAAVEAYNQAMDTYWEAYSVYEDKLNRDEAREELSSLTYTYDTYDLYYFNGKETKVADNYNIDSYPITSSVSPIIFFQTKDFGEKVKVSMSEMESTYGIYSTITSLMDNYVYQTTPKKHIAVGATISDFDWTDARSYTFAENGKTVYFLADINEENSLGTLYTMSLGEDNKFQKAASYDTDVHSYSVIDGKCIYMKDVTDSGKGDLYINKNRIDFDVYQYGYTYNKETDSFLYLTDWSTEKQNGTLKIYKNGVATTISDEVADFKFANDGKILFLYDYSFNLYKGELRLYDDGQLKKISDDVVAIVPMYSLEVRNQMMNLYIS